MLLVDTDHATSLKYPESERGRRFIDRLTAVPKAEIVGVAIVTVEERMRVSAHGPMETIVYCPHLVYEWCSPYRFGVRRQQTSSGRRLGVTARITRRRRASISAEATRKRPGGNSSIRFSLSSGQH
jgi:hypothetical protein